MNAARTAVAQPELLPDAAITRNDWLMRAFARLQRMRAPAWNDLTLDAALADPAQGGIVRGFAAQLEGEHDRRQRRRGRLPSRRAWHLGGRR